MHTLQVLTLTTYAQNKQRKPLNDIFVDGSPSATVTAAPFEEGEDRKFPEVSLLPPPLPTELASLLRTLDGQECLPLSPPPLPWLAGEVLWGLLPMEGEVAGVLPSPPLPTWALPHLHPSAILSPSAL